MEIIKHMKLKQSKTNIKEKTKISDELNDEYLKRLDAFDKLYIKVKDLSIDKNTSKDDAIKDVLNIFNLEDNFEEFELKITFNDDEEIEFEDK